MKEVFSMWKHTKMIVLVALTAAIYAALLIPFKAIPIIPGFTELRPGNVIPVTFGLLFGPAGAWGAAIGNTVGDLLGGTLGIGSAFGFIGNFLFAYIPYKVWDNLGILRKDELAPDLKGGKKIGLYILVAILASAGCALFIGWGVDLLGFVPFAALGTIITVNNAFAAVVLGLPFTLLLYPRIKKWDLYWKDIMPEAELPRGGAIARTGAYLMVICVVVGLIGTLAIALGVGQQAFGAGFGAGGAQNMGVEIFGGIFSVGMLIAGLLMI